ncbi:succinylglutamate desuccinylase [Celerinatantimonas yamalensis]|uniref:Succinylglutamate desuccinylase n=1 Tax=Celerinatantimonas yamalensis TaxID=559956 RepID=A0ABW9G2F9_9GAMM
MLPFSFNYLEYLLTHPNEQPGASTCMPDGSTMRLVGVGVIQVTPAHLHAQHKAIVLSAGIHGNETAPIEWLNTLLNDLLDGHLQICHPLLLIFGHPLAMVAKSRELKFNLNRLFAGAHTQHPEDGEHQRAAQLERWMADFYALWPNAVRLHYDLHTAIRESIHEKFAVAPYIPERAHDLSQLAFLQKCGVDCVLFFHQATTTFSYHSAATHQAFAFTIELGRVHPFGQNDMRRLQLLDQAVRALITTPVIDWGKPDWQRCCWFRVTDVIIRKQANFRLNFPDELSNFTEFYDGDVLAYQDEQMVRVENGPKSVVFPNANVQVGQRAALLVQAMSQDECQQLNQ